MKKPSKTSIKESLFNELKNKNKETEYYIDLIFDYMDLYELKKELKKDIDEKGVRYESTNGNGKTVEKANESIVSLHKTTQMMLKILQDIGLQDPIKSSGTSDYI